MRLWVSTMTAHRSHNLHPDPSSHSGDQGCPNLTITRTNPKYSSKRSTHQKHISHKFIYIFIILSAILGAKAEHVRNLEISEGAPVGTRIGYIGDGSALSLDSGPPYLIVPVPGSAVDSDLAVDQNTGEIRTKVPLDRERRASYSLVAIPLSGQNVRVMVKVLDDNDNAPTFPSSMMNIEFPENTPRDVKRTLNPARDLDLGDYNTQRYNIVSGNKDNAFRLSSHREKDGVLYLDLQINGFLDRETTEAYSLVIEALDGGTPPLKGEMIVNITIQDVNDNQPIFNQSRYFATIPENSTVGTSVLQVFATDIDAKENGQVEYSINRRQSDKENMFRIDPTTGLIAVNKPLDFETKELHELVIVAKDHGLQPLETTAFVSIRVTDVNDNQPQINVIFLSDDATPKISESAQLGDFVARISVHDPDSRTEYSNVTVLLEGGEGHFELTQKDNIIYLMIIALPLDRESQPNYTLNVTAKDAGSPPLHASRTIHLRVTDINDNAPEFEREVYSANVMEVSDPGTSVIQVSAVDKDEGNNSAVTYSLLDTPDSHSNWFEIDSRSGLITTRAHVDCETDPVPQLVVVATDNGHPPLSSTATVLVTIHDVNDNEPIFDQSFYNVSVPENESVGRCVLKVSATDPDCGVNAVVNYSIGNEGAMGKLHQFQVRPTTGELCVSAALDFETRSIYEFPIVATDRGGLSTTAIVKIQVTDVNDNRPIFYPREYNVSLREDIVSTMSRDTPVVAVVATDQDSGRNSAIFYKIISGNEAGAFHIDRTSGELFVAKPDLLISSQRRSHRINVSATDGAGLRALQDAEVFVSLIGATQTPPIFDKPRYSYVLRENVNRNTVVGSVRATSSSNKGNRGSVRYSIYSGDPDGYFAIDSDTGTIRTYSSLDHEAHPTVLLNIQAMSGEPPAYGHTQVNIGIEDVNDNSPEFESSSVRISVPENVEPGTPLYAAHARDKDSGRNGIVRYRVLTSNPQNINRKSSKNGNQYSDGQLFTIDPHSGHLTLSRRLDYESIQHHSVLVNAIDQGEPQLSSNLTIYVDVQDVNDNSPTFERAEYNIQVLESLSVNTEILQVTAIDLDTGNNARITYRLISANTSTSNYPEVFGVFPNSGWVYLKDTLDRETRPKYDLTIVATDNGAPSLSATARVKVLVIDANDNDPVFEREFYSFSVEENLRRGAVVGVVKATDADEGVNAAIRYSLIPSNTSFQINPVTGEITTREPLDREMRSSYDLIAEAKDLDGSAVPGSNKPGYGKSPNILETSRKTRVNIHIEVLDINDNAPIILAPRDDVVWVREQQPIGTEVVRIQATDPDAGRNSTITYSLLHLSENSNEDSTRIAKLEGSSDFPFEIDPNSGVIRTLIQLERDIKAVYRLTIAAVDAGKPPKQTVRVIRVEVLDLNDNRPTFSSSSLVFRVREDVPIGFNIGSVAPTENKISDNLVSGDIGPHITYTLTALPSDDTGDVTPDKIFDIDRASGSLVVAHKLDFERKSEYRLEIRALDTSSSPQSSAVTVRIDIDDVNDNPPRWSRDPIIIPISENTPVGTHVYNFTATDADSGSNGELRYDLVKQYPKPIFTIDSLTGTLTLLSGLDFEDTKEHVLIVKATDQSSNVTERLSTSATVRVIVTDFNDNSPSFFSPNTQTIVVGESITVGMMLYRLIALDRDSGENGRVSYLISSGNEDAKFKLDHDTGALILAKSLESSVGQYRSNNKIVLNVTAVDHGVPARQVHKELKIVVRQPQRQPPRFAKAVYHANVSEDARIGSFVIKVEVTSGLTEGINLTYQIPPGIADDHFTIDPVQGIVTTHASLDREKHSRYTVPIYAIAESLSADSSSAHFDVATLLVTVTDVDDNGPTFAVGACYPMAIPENQATSVVHTVVAADLDVGTNADVNYMITAGNINNKFIIDAHTGALSARPLDRETVSRYRLTVSASGRNTAKSSSSMSYSSTSSFPAKSVASCNITISVSDVNDNEPVFERTRYSAIIAEDSPIDSSVLTVKAKDTDFAANSRIIYSLAEEENWLFRIDNKTGLITTAGLLDREKQSLHKFFVVATDTAKYETRSTRVPVQITISDVNDNSPVFTKYPFKQRVPAYTQPGHTLAQVSATDADEGTNADILYSFVNEESEMRLRMNPNTGVITVARSLNIDNGKILRIEIAARDKGNPPRMAVGLLELQIGDLQESTPSLRFQTTIYNVSMPESSQNGKEVVQVSAVRSDGRRQNISYRIGTGNHQEIFEINSESGLIRIQNSKPLDYEITPVIKLIVEAHTDGPPTIYGYCEVIINLIDENDNAPRFTQTQYNAAVWESKSKGTFVIQVKALDADRGANSRILYHIVDGNLDNAFVIEPAFSGIVKTNIVLDREIRDWYRLTVIATDEGVPQMTGTTAIMINIVDVNDNRPTFPPHSVISVSEATEIGTVLTTISANDVDTSPALTYSFSDDTDAESRNLFTIDRYSGRVSLRRLLDYETRKEYVLRVTASDTLHEAKTVLTVRVTDVNDNTPVFQQPAYHVTLPEGEANSKIEILTVNATDADSEENSVIKYYLVDLIPGFSIDNMTGTIYFNRSFLNSSSNRNIQLTVIAKDSGKPSLSSIAPVKIHMYSASKPKNVQHRNSIRLQIPENAQKGTVVTRLETEDNHNYIITEGNEGNFFEIGHSNNLIVLKTLDRESQESYTLKLSTVNQIQGHYNNATDLKIYITVEDVNDNAPIFQQNGYDISLSESTPIGNSVMKITATDADLEGSQNSIVTYEITSGNDARLFYMNSETGLISVNDTLDFDVGSIEYFLIVRACDKGDIPLCSITSVKITLEDENDNAPRFPVAEYLEFVPENEPVGTTVFKAHAIDLDTGLYGSVNYSIVSEGDAFKLFRINPVTGLIVTDSVFDYEQRYHYIFTVRASDSGGKSAIVKVRVEIESRDEFYPQFTERTYHFIVPTPSSGHLPVGYVLGHVIATDRDKGSDGRIAYQLTKQHTYFKINRTTGALVVKKKLNNDVALREASHDINLFVTASSGRQGSLSNMTVVEIVFDKTADIGTNLASVNGNNTTVAAASNGIADWVVGLLISLILIILIFGAVFLFIHMRSRRHKNINKPNLSSETVASSNNYVDPSAFDTITIRGNNSVSASVSNQFAPPKYDEIPPYGVPHPASSNSGAATTSELSGSEQSGSSGRGSAEDDGEDEEIRMINEGPIQRDSGIHRQNDDDDNISDVSVHNTQEYLARLGIVDNTASNVAQNPSTSKDTLMHHQIPMDALHIFDEEGATDPDLTNLIYAKLNDVGSDHANSTDDDGAVSAVSLGAAVDHVMMSAFGDVQGPTHQPSMNGSLSSIVHSEEELTGSYNWDYLLDWGPQYQPLAHVFSEIARLKDDTASVKSANSGNSSIKSKNVNVPVAKNIPPPLLTNVAPRSIPVPILSARNASTSHGQIMLLPRSPISHDATTGTGFNTSAAMSPSFSPSLSPLATKSPSISPLVTPGLLTAHHVVSLPRQVQSSRNKSTIDTELRI